MHYYDFWIQLSFNLLAVVFSVAALVRRTPGPPGPPGPVGPPGPKGEDAPMTVKDRRRLSR